MKSIQVVGLTSTGTILFSDANQIKQGTFEGLTINRQMTARHLMRPYTKKRIDCKFGKNMTKIRYADIQFYEKMLGLNAAKLNLPQLEESKLFTVEQKERLRKVSTNLISEQDAESLNNIRDYTTNRKLLPQLLGKLKSVEGTLEYLAEELCISFESQNLTNYVPIKLRNIDHYFQLIEKTCFGKFLQNNSGLLPVNLLSCKYNLVKKQYEIEASLPVSVEKTILSEGWGTASLKNLNLINPQVFSELRKSEQEAKTAHRGIFAKPFEILSLVYTKNNLVAVVEEILEGYIYKIRAKNDDIIKIEMAKIYCPLGNEAGAFACREFARKNLIGREVNVFLTKDEGLNILGSLVRFSDNKDIESLMIQNGYGFVKEELKGTMFYGKLQTLQKKAKDLRKGIHNEKSVGYQFYEDFTVAHSKKEKLEKKNTIQSKQHYLRQSQIGDEGVIDKCIDPITYIVRIDSHKKIVKVKLDGVSKFVANPRLPEVIELQKKSETFCHKNFYQRTVSLELMQYNEASNCFIGILRHTGKGREKISLQESLLSQGLVIVSKNGFLQQKWVECQKQAESKQIGCWSEKLKNFVRNDILDSEGKEFKGKFSWVEDGETAYVQPASMTEKLDMVYDILCTKQELKPVSQEDLVPGYLCAAQYQQQFCRARIISIDKTVLVKFVDWGNKQTLPINSLRQLPNKLQYLPPLCCEVSLDLVQALTTRNPDHLEKMRQFLMESDCMFVKSYENVVNVYIGNRHLNTALIQEGYVKADLSKIRDESVKKHFMDEMDRLRKDLVGVWDLEQGSDVDQNDYD